MPASSGTCFFKQQSKHDCLSKNRVDLISYMNEVFLYRSQMFPFGSFYLTGLFWDMEILASTIRSDTHLLALEALFIGEVKLFLNTQNTKEQDYKRRQLRIFSNN